MARAKPRVGRNRFIAPLGKATGIAPFGEADGAIKRLRPTTSGTDTKLMNSRLLLERRPWRSLPMHRKRREPHFDLRSGVNNRALVHALDAERRSAMSRYTGISPRGARFQALTGWRSDWQLASRRDSPRIASLGATA